MFAFLKQFWVKKESVREHRLVFFGEVPGQGGKESREQEQKQDEKVEGVDTLDNPDQAEEQRETRISNADKKLEPKRNLVQQGADFANKVQGGGERTPEENGNVTPKLKEDSNSPENSEQLQQTEKQIKDSLNKAGMTVSGVSITMENGTPTAVVLEGVGEKLVAALMKAGITAEVGGNVTLSNEVIQSILSGQEAGKDGSESKETLDEGIRKLNEARENAKRMIDPAVLENTPLGRMIDSVQFVKRGDKIVVVGRPPADIINVGKSLGYRVKRGHLVRKGEKAIRRVDNATGGTFEMSMEQAFGKGGVEQGVKVLTNWANRLSKKAPDVPNFKPEEYKGAPPKSISENTSEASRQIQQRLQDTINGMDPSMKETALGKIVQSLEVKEGENGSIILSTNDSGFPYFFQQFVAGYGEAKIGDDGKQMAVIPKDAVDNLGWQLQRMEVWFKVQETSGNAFSQKKEPNTKPKAVPQEPLAKEGPVDSPESGAKTPEEMQRLTNLAQNRVESISQHLSFGHGNGNEVQDHLAKLNDMLDGEGVSAEDKETIYKEMGILDGKVVDDPNSGTEFRIFIDKDGKAAVEEVIPPDVPKGKPEAQKKDPKKITRFPGEGAHFSVKDKIPTARVRKVTAAETRKNNVEEAFTETKEKIRRIISREEASIRGSMENRDSAGPFGKFHRWLTKSDPYKLDISNAKRVIGTTGVAERFMNQARAETDPKKKVDTMNKARRILGMREIKGEQFVVSDKAPTSTGVSRVNTDTERYDLEQKLITVSREVAIDVGVTVASLGTGTVANLVRKGGMVAAKEIAVRTVASSFRQRLGQLAQKGGVKLSEKAIEKISQDIAIEVGKDFDSLKNINPERYANMSDNDITSQVQKAIREAMPANLAEQLSRKLQA